MSALTIAQRNGIRILTFRHHLLTVSVLSSLARTLDELAADPLPTVVAGGERIFLAGANLGEIAGLAAGTSGAYADRGRSVLARLERFPAPVVMAVRGACVGGGLDLALAGDLVVVHPGARLGHPGVRRGLVTGWGGTARLTGLAATARARVLLTGSLFNGEEAVAAGLADLLAENPEETAAATARRVAGLPPGRLAAWRLLKNGRFVDRPPIPVVHRVAMTNAESGERP